MGEPVHGIIHPVTKPLPKPYTSYTPESHRLDIPHVSQSCPPSFTRKASPLVLKSLNVAKVYNKRKQREGGWQEALDPFTETACLAGQKLLESFKLSFTCRGSLASLLGQTKTLLFLAAAATFAASMTIALGSNTVQTISLCFKEQGL